ncbi:HSF-type DNA-binding-domain-containing protein, partial [Mycena polygramma]
FISWTELGTSFVVSNVGEFSRSILGSHFKHNNFSSFVRQLNMYGFHKIDRTPRAQRTTSDAQTWEFSHHKFLRGRPDLLDEIKRTALEPDLALKHTASTVATQLSAMREENQHMSDQLNAEHRRVEKLVSVGSRLWDVVGDGFGSANSLSCFITDCSSTAIPR